MITEAETPPELATIGLPGFWTDVRRRCSSGRAVLAIRGGAWSIGGYVATQLLRMGATLVLARHFIGPEAFGLVGLVGVFLSGLNMFSELGLVANIVQHSRGDDPKFLNTAFSIQAGRGTAIWIGSHPCGLSAGAFLQTAGTASAIGRRRPVGSDSGSNQSQHLDSNPACKA